jgi:guanylate cyclase
VTAQKIKDARLQVTNRQQKGSFQFVVIKVRFDNGAIEADRKLKEKSMTLNEYLPVDSFSFLSMFPYFITFNKKLEVQLCGRALMNVVPDLGGQRMDEQFDLQRPCIKFTWDGVRLTFAVHTNC